MEVVERRMISGFNQMTLGGEAPGWGLEGGGRLCRESDRRCLRTQSSRSMKRTDPTFGSAYRCVKPDQRPYASHSPSRRQDEKWHITPDEIKPVLWIWTLTMALRSQKLLHFILTAVVNLPFLALSPWQTQSTGVNEIT
jgi:hypothetical protein